MDYYANIYDVDFFNKDIYTIKYSNLKLDISIKGPIWESWQGDSSIDNILKALNLIKNQSYTIDKSLITPNEEKILLMLLTQKAYREDNDILFFNLSRQLLLVPEFKLQVIKLMYAWKAKNYLTFVKKNKMQEILENVINYIKLNDRKEITNQDIKVEIPVKKDFDRLNIHLDNQEELLKFYQETYSYIIELTAANYQVETLFNYSVILDFLSMIGIKHIYDYGAGIGTFLFLATKWKITGKYYDLKSKTMDFAKLNLNRLSSSITFHEINPKQYDLPNGIECIICTEVLEHIYDPEDLIHKFYNSLKPNGILIVSESYDYIDEFCTHLPQHKGKGGDVFIKSMLNVGFINIPLEFDIHPKVFIKQ